MKYQVNLDSPTIFVPFFAQSGQLRSLPIRGQFDTYFFSKAEVAKTWLFNLTLFFMKILAAVFSPVSLTMKLYLPRCRKWFSKFQNAINVNLRPWLFVLSKICNTKNNFLYDGIIKSPRKFSKINFSRTAYPNFALKRLSYLTFHMTIRTLL